VTSKQLNQAEINQLTSCVGKLFALVNYLFCFFPLTQKKIRKKKKTKKKKRAKVEWLGKKTTSVKLPMLC
jgi:hypothetical protein